MEIDEAGKHQASGHMDGSTRLRSVVRLRTYNRVALNQHFSRAMDSTFRIDDSSAGNSEIKLHATPPGYMELNSPNGPGLAGIVR